MSLRNRSDGVHVARVPIDMDGHYDPRSRRDRSLDGPRVHGQGIPLHVDEDRPRP